MHNLGDLATITHGAKLRAAARDHRWAYAARRTGHRGTPARWLADLRIPLVPLVPRGRRAAQTY